MKKLLLFSLLSLTMFGISFGQSGWINISNAYTGHFNDVYFINADTGYSVGSTGDIIITSNGGTSGIAVSVTTTPLNSVFFINDSTGFVAGNNGKIYKTTNYGLSWIQKTIATTANLNKIFFVNDTLGFVAGAGGVFYQTNNAGDTWVNNVVSGTTNNINSMHFTSSTTGFVVGATSFSGFISRTVSTGAYWPTTYNTIAAMNDVAFYSATNGFAVGENGALYKTTNGGTNWNYTASPSIQNLNAIRFVNANVGYIVGDSGTVMKTVDGGTTWIVQPTLTLSHLYAVSTVNQNVVYAGGYLGTAIKTTSGGNYLTISVPDYNVYCKGYTNLTSTVNYNGTGTLTYSWASSPFLNATNIANPTAGPLTSTKKFYVTVTDGVLNATDSSTVSVVALNPDSICIVTVSDTSKSNVIVFEKHISGPIDFYKIYRESTVANIFDSIGFIPADSVGVFIDTASNPAVKPYAYKISSVDSCGNESALSFKHTTMHLTINAGVGNKWNLIWSPYLGLSIPTYRIWRGDSLHNLHLLDSVPGTSITYTDTNPPAGRLYYQVEVISSYNCQPYNYKVNTNYNSSRSNKADNGIIPSPIVVIADFSATPTSGNHPINVTFTSLCGGNPTYWKWYFGDGDSSSLENPSHIYTVKGVYSVKLVAWNNSDIDTIEKVGFINAHNNSIEDVINDKDVKIYPNPSKKSQTISISMNKAFINEISLFDLVGREVLRKEINPTTKTELNISGLPAGVYVIRLKTVQGQVLKKKLIIE